MSVQTHITGLAFANYSLKSMNELNVYLIIKRRKDKMTYPPQELATRAGEAKASE